MRGSRARGGWVRATLGAALLLALALGGTHGAAQADDVPAGARKEFDEAKALYLKGDPKSLAGAFSALSKGKAKAGESADFWELYARVWRASKKPEADLWEKIILPREQAAPASPAFDLVRYRLETDPALKRGHLEKAIAKDPAATGPQLLLARELRAQGEETQAEELVDKILEKSPELEDALVVKAELMIEGGLSRMAMKFAQEQLAKKECPGLRHILALAQRNLGAEEAELKVKALENAQKAVDARPDPAFVATLADLLDENDRVADAVALLKKHVATNPDARLTQRLGAFAWRAGDYDGAVPQLASAAASDLRAAKALALAHARRNRPKEALAASEQMLALDKEQWESAAEVALELGDTALMRKRIAGRTGDTADWFKVAADSMDGKVAEVAAACGKQAADGSREGEEMLLLLLEARINARLGPKAAAFAKQWRDVRAQVVAAGVPSAKPVGKPIEMVGKSHGYMQRTATYQRSICGDWMEAGDIGMNVRPNADGTPNFGWAVEAKSECAREPQRMLRFKIAMEGNQIQLNPHGEVWEAASKAFTEGCAALVADDAAKADEAFGKALEQEGGWHRARFLRAAANALKAGGDVAAAAKEALESVGLAPDDWFARELSIKLHVLGGGDPVALLKDLVAHTDARSHGPLSEL